MSYDFLLFKARPGEDPLETAQREADFSTPPNPQYEVINRRVTDALVAHNPRLEVSEHDSVDLERMLNLTSHAEYFPRKYTELNDSSNEFGVQINLSDDEASVAVPYWHDGVKAESAFRVIWNYLEIIQRETDYLIYDPQVGCIFTTSTSFQEALASYADGVKNVQGLAARNTPPESPRKPWWKFW